MDRRDFLRFRRDDPAWLAELDCRVLYLRCLDAALTQQSDEPESADQVGEPPARFARRSPISLLQAVARDLAGKKRLRLVESHWLEQSPFCAEFRRVLAQFQDGGGRIEFVARRSDAAR
jgi:hypothetical protein